MSASRRWRRAASAALLCALAPAPAALAAFVTIPAAKDNTLYESATGAFSNGAGPNFFVGRVDVISGGTRRRAVIAFDVAGNVPAGATIVGVSLTLNMSRTKITVGLQPVSLHRLLADWGEGTSVAAGGGGGGAPSTPGDATWIHRFYNTIFWSRAGGDFAATPSSTIQVGPIGQYTWLSTPGMVADAQAWLDAPASNFGWILVGNETTFPTAKRFDSRENINPGARPMLTIEFAAAVPGAGRVPDGGATPGTPLTLAHAGNGDLLLSWAGSCVPGDSDYEIYAGSIGAFSSYSPLVCGTGGATQATITPGAGSLFYLVVPRNAAREGSYGVDSAGFERAPGQNACLTQAIASCP